MTRRPTDSPNWGGSRPSTGRPHTRLVLHFKPEVLEQIEDTARKWGYSKAETFLHDVVIAQFLTPMPGQDRGG
jgi:hypothetical protein